MATSVLVKNFSLYQKTLAQKVILEGIGVHSGSFSSLCIMPAPAGMGIVFKNSLFSDPSEALVIGRVIPESAMHATVLKAKSWGLSTVEHLMAACSFFDIDNLYIEVTGFEIPILDGSALQFLQAFELAGVVEQSAKKLYLTPQETILIQDAHGRFISITPHEDSADYNLSVEYSADFNHPLVGALTFSGQITNNFFEHEVAPARTFGFLEQLSYLRSHKLAQGSTLGNTAVMGDDAYLNELRFDDECVRHKVLDLLGDLALLGHRLVGTIRAAKTGHSFNRLVIQHYLEHPEAWRLF